MCETLGFVCYTRRGAGYCVTSDEITNSQVSAGTPPLGTPTIPHPWRRPSSGDRARRGRPSCAPSTASRTARHPPSCTTRTRRSLSPSACALPPTTPCCAALDALSLPLQAAPAAAHLRQPARHPVHGRAARRRRRRRPHGLRQDDAAPAVPRRGGLDRRWARGGVHAATARGGNVGGAARCGGDGRDARRHGGLRRALRRLLRRADDAAQVHDRRPADP
jgi:hypothetical protein